MALDLFYPLEKGVLKYRPDSSGRISAAGEENREAAAVEELVRHVVELADIRQNQSVRAVVGAPAMASLNDKQAVIDVLHDQVDAVMVISEPFLVAFGLGLYNNGVVVDIGAGSLDLCRMHGTIPARKISGHCTRRATTSTRTSFPASGEGQGFADLAAHGPKHQGT